MYSDISDSLKEELSNQDSERKRRKQLNPHKMDEDNQEIDLKGIKQNMKNMSQVPVVAQTQGKQQKKSFKDMKIQSIQNQQNERNLSNFQLLNSIPNNAQKSQANGLRQNFKSQKNESLSFVESQGPNTQSFYQESQHPDQIDEEDEMEVDDQVKRNTFMNKQNKINQQQSTIGQNISKAFHENLNLKSINDIDKSLLKQNEMNKNIKKQQIENLKYVNLNEIPSDWSLKTSIEISCILKNESDSVSINFSKIQKYLQYYVYSTDQKLSGFDNFIGIDQNNIFIIIDKEQQKTQQKIQWLRSFRDVYKKFLGSAGDENSNRGQLMPFFYVRNSNFMALFRIKEGRPMVILHPSKNLARVIQDSSIIKTVVNISHDEDEEREQQEKLRQEKNRKEQESDDDDLIDDQDRLNYLLENNENNQQFNFIPKNQSQLFYFDNKAVNSIYNILSNFIANQIESGLYGYQTSQNSGLAQILAPQPFINCTYNEAQMFYSGNVAYANKSYRFQMKLFGVFFPFNLQSMSQVIKSQVRQSQQNNLSSEQQQNQQDNNREIEIQMKSDDQSKLFSYKKCIKMIKFSTNPQLSNQLQQGQTQINPIPPFKVMFD